MSLSVESKLKELDIDKSSPELRDFLSNFYSDYLATILKQVLNCSIEDAWVSGEQKDFFLTLKFSKTQMHETIKSPNFLSFVQVHPKKKELESLLNAPTN